MPNDATPNGAPPPPLERRLATILCADVAGYSQMMGADEERTVRVFRGHREIFESLVTLHRGRIFNTAGDALLAEFNSAVEAVRCATEIQAALATRNALLAHEERMLFRMGINLGDVIVQGGDLLGDGVNVAARIQAATQPGGICISGSVYDQIQNKLSLDFKLLGEQTYKNIAKPVRTYTINEGAAVTAPVRRHSSKLPLVLAASLLAIGGAGYWAYSQYDARHVEQARIESQMAAQIAVHKQAAEQAQRAAEDARREGEAQKAKYAADETLRRAQEERTRLEQERKSFANEKRAAEAKPKEAASPALPAAAAALASTNASSTPLPSPLPSPPPVAATRDDGHYSGQFCNAFKDIPRPVCWTTALVVRNGIAEGNWVSASKKTAIAKGRISASGALELKVTAWLRAENPVETVLVGSVGDGKITASGQWRNGDAISGNWKRM